MVRKLVVTCRCESELNRVGLLPGGVPFTGSRFEHLAGGGDRPEAADRITAEDLVAVQTLSITVPASAALDILEGPLGAQLSGLLHDIPRHIDMADAGVPACPR